LVTLSYKERSHGEGGWIESGNPSASQSAPLATFLPPPTWGVGAHVKHLYNPYVYFWRWATWKVFDLHPSHDRGVVCFITVAGFLNGPGFERMRDYLRRRADAIYVIDCSPEGHQPPISTRVFQAVQQPVCITLVVRDGSTGSEVPAPVRFRQLARGDRTAKFTELAGISLAGSGWQACPDDWRAPFLPAGGERWTSFPTLDDLLRWSGSGVMPGRTWVIAPDKATLRQRWNALIGATDKADLFLEHQHDRRIDTTLSDGLPGFPAKSTPIGQETGPCPEPVRIGYRSFDRQWIIPDKPLINRPNPTLWAIRSSQQVYLTALHRTSPVSGPAVTFTAGIPDLDHYKGSFGGRAYPLWLDAHGTVANVVPGLLEHLASVYGHGITAEDLFAYLAGILAHPDFVATFGADLSTPGIRVPITADAALFERATAIGRRVLWLHTYGERFTDPDDDRPKQPPRLPPATRPRVLAEHPIPSSSDGMPDGELGYDPAVQELRIGTGKLRHVTARMRHYEVSRVNVLDKWFSYRRKNREHPVIGDRRTSRLLEIHAQSWPAEYTSELIDLLNVLGLLAELEPQQAVLLSEILNQPLITIDDLTRAGVLPVPSRARKPSQLVKNQQISVLDLGV
jgi:Type ISP C-terminal specificity domain